MKNMFNKTGKILISLLVFSAAIFNGCEKDKEEALQLPPESAFAIDVSIFTSQTKSTSVSDTRINFATAAGVVTFWNLMIAGVMTIPTAAYIKAFEYKPVRESNEKWKWSYSVACPLNNYTAELYGEIVGAEVEWKMVISQQGGFQDYLMFDGSSNIQRTAGYWRLYELPPSNAEFLKIDWTYDWEEQTGGVKYIYTKSGAEAQGNYIEYGVTANNNFNVYYNLYNKQDNKLFNINLNSTTHEGRIEYDGNSYCWDSELYDIVCTE